MSASCDMFKKEVNASLYPEINPIPGWIFDPKNEKIVKKKASPSVKGSITWKFTEYKHDFLKERARPSSRNRDVWINEFTLSKEEHSFIILCNGTYFQLLKTYDVVQGTITDVKYSRSVALLVCSNDEFSREACFAYLNKIANGFAAKLDDRTWNSLKKCFILEGHFALINMRQIRPFDSAVLCFKEVVHIIRKMKSYEDYYLVSWYFSKVNSEKTFKEHIGNDTSKSATGSNRALSSGIWTNKKEFSNLTDSVYSTNQGNGNNAYIQPIKGIDSMTQNNVRPQKTLSSGVWSHKKEFSNHTSSVNFTGASNEKNVLFQPSKENVQNVVKPQRTLSNEIWIKNNECENSKDDTTISITQGSLNSSQSKYSLKKSVLDDFTEDYGTKNGMILKKLKVTENHRDSKSKIQKVTFGTPSENIETKVILLVGAIGSGKTTLINAIVNYLFRIDFTDDFRLIVADDDNVTKHSLAESQTDMITSYALYYLPGMPFQYNYILIDTPGFGDTRGIRRDQEMMAQLDSFLKQYYGIVGIDGVGFVTPTFATQSKLRQKYIFDGLSSIFGQDIKNNIHIMATFADSKNPLVLKALTDIEVHFSGIYKFDNRSLYLKNTVHPVEECELSSSCFDDEDELYICKLVWKMSFENLRNFFKEIEKSTPIRLKLTKETEGKLLASSVSVICNSSVDDKGTVKELLRQSKKIVASQIPLSSETLDCKNEPGNFANSLNSSEESSASIVSSQPSKDKFIVSVTQCLLSESQSKSSLKKSVVEDFTEDYGTNIGMRLKKLKMIENRKNSKSKVQKVSFGTPSENTETKVILLVGAIGSGKTTLINAMVNYIFRIDFTDDFRLIITDDNDAIKRSQAESQTDFITAYVFNYLPGMPFQYNYIFIDTPGFEDTIGILKDQKIIAHLEFFLKQDFGIDHVDGLGFVTPASTSQMTQTQRYVFDGFCSFLGKDVKHNIFIMTTFANSKEPSVLATMKSVQADFDDDYKFNNSSLYAVNENHSNNLTQISVTNFLWEMGYQSLERFFIKLKETSPASLALTKEVLEKRYKLHATIVSIKHLIYFGLLKLDNMNREQVSLLRKNDDICANYEISKDISELYCYQCNFSCHFPCSCFKSNNPVKVENCVAMAKDGSCLVCPSKCLGNFHKFRTESISVKLQKNCIAKNIIIKNLVEDFEIFSNDFVSVIRNAHDQIQKMENICINFNSILRKDYIECLIKSERKQKRPNFLKRIKTLETLKTEYSIVSGVQSVSFDGAQVDGITILKHFKGVLNN